VHSVPVPRPTLSRPGPSAPRSTPGRTRSTRSPNGAEQARAVGRAVLLSACSWPPWSPPTRSSRPPHRRPRRFPPMQGQPEIIEFLNEALTAELTAVNQYFGHSRMLSNWGYKTLADHARDESMDEMKHADALIERIIFLEGMPNLQRLGSVRLGEDPVEQLRLDLEVEVEAVDRFNRGIALAVEQGDNGTRELLAGM